MIKFTNSFIISKICDKKKRKEKVRVPKVDTIYPLKWRHLNKIPVSALLSSSNCCNKLRYNHKVRAVFLINTYGKGERYLSRSWNFGTAYKTIEIGSYS